MSIASGATLGGQRQHWRHGDGARWRQSQPGSSPGTLTVGSLVLNDSSLLNFEVDTPGVVGSGVNDLVSVTNGLTLDGILNIITGSNFGTGTYRLFDYGTLTADNGLVFGDVPAGYELTFSLATPGEVNLVAITPACSSGTAGRPRRTTPSTAAPAHGTAARRTGPARLAMWPRAGPA
ncbi:hypothetical protein [Pannonibacter phragmitetus]|uniref:hypothetical protein n=1 Tax=Pannonibacter phragmitetus TaxID=121719 RepID=UPI0012FD20F8|nr:hypothetical protein [Pannonibacter phragmitetus]